MSDNKRIVKHEMDYISELPDCVLSCILSKLSMKDLFKTSLLSQRWSKLWVLMRDLTFDIHNMLGTEKELLQAGYVVEVEGKSTTEKILNLNLSIGKFVEGVDQFLKNFQGTKIDSFLVKFCLTNKQNSIIDKWISFAIAKGVERIDLLLIGENHYPNSYSLGGRYKFPFALFSESNASTLKHMRLQHCNVWNPAKFDFLPFRNLRSLVLEKAKVDDILITSLLSYCLLLEELSLLSCQLKPKPLKITSSSLCRLKVNTCFFYSKTDRWAAVNFLLLDCLKLTSLEFSHCSLEALSINTPSLKSIYHMDLSAYLPIALALFGTIPQLEILHLVTFTNPKVKISLESSSLRFKHLRQLKLTVHGDCWSNREEFDISWILIILQASPLLQKLSVMITRPSFTENQKDIKDLGIFSHDEVKVIEIGGCVGNWYEIEFAMNVLKCVHKLERIVLSPYWRYNDFCNWDSEPGWFQNGRERVREKLQKEVVGRAELILL